MKFSIKEITLDSNVEDDLYSKHNEFLNWPLVYLLKNIPANEAYVGETTDVVTRLKTHIKSKNKKRLSSAHIISSELFNKSAALDMEANLIRYLSADGKYSLLNGNLGIANHQYYQQKEIYWHLFKDVWDQLRGLGIARHSLDYIDNSDLFKYSPYKSLSKEQIVGLKTILHCLLDDSAKTSLIQGGAGTGKSILAIFLFKLLKTDLQDFNFSDFDEEDTELFHLVRLVREKYGDLQMALVIPMSSFRHTIANVFKNIQGLKSSMVVGPSEVVKRKYDLLVVDEGHRLRRRVNLGTYFGTFDTNAKTLGIDPSVSTELDWINMQSSKSIIFYDPLQSIKPSDVAKESFAKLKSQNSTRSEILHTQFRVKGGNKYVSLINKIFQNETVLPNDMNIGYYDLLLFENLADMVQKIKEKEQAKGLCRLVAGYAWEWVSKKDKSKYDIEIGEVKLKWNSVDKDWVNSPNATNEVGCIHTTQGYDLNYAGIIIGPELDYDFNNKCLIIYKDKYKDKNGKMTIKSDEELLSYIVNIYQTILLRGIEGTYIYVCNENLRIHLSTFFPKYIEQQRTARKIEFVPAPTAISVPFYHLQIAAGNFSDLQKVEEIKYIEVPTLSQHRDYFVCQVIGESMNKIIPNGAYCLFKKYYGGSRNGLITLVESTNIYDHELGGNYTIKEYSSKKTADEDGWKHEEIVLKPCSTENFDPIVLRDEETVDLKVIGIFESVLFESGTIVNN